MSTPRMARFGSIAIALQTAVGTPATTPTNPSSSVGSTVPTIPPS